MSLNLSLNFKLTHMAQVESSKVWTMIKKFKCTYHALPVLTVAPSLLRFASDVAFVAEPVVDISLAIHMRPQVHTECCHRLSLTKGRSRWATGNRGTN